MLTALQTTTAHEFFATVMPSWLGTEALGELDGRFEFRIGTDTSSPGGTWLVDFDDRVVRTVRAGSDASSQSSQRSNDPKPHVIVQATARDFMALVDGSMPAPDGLISNRLHITGDVVRADQLMKALARTHAGSLSGSTS